MLEFDVYRHRSLREALRAWFAAGEGDPETPSVSELAGLAGYAHSTLFNAISGERRLRGRLALGRAMGLDLKGALHLTMLASLDAAGPEERDRLEGLLTASRYTAERASEAGRSLKRGPWRTHGVETLATALPVLRHAGLRPGARALAQDLWPAISVARAARVLSTGLDSAERPWLTVSADASDVHLSALRRLSSSLLELDPPRRRTPLSLWAASPEAEAEAATLIDQRLDEIAEQNSEGDGPRLVMHLGARLVPVARLPASSICDGPAWIPGAPSAPLPPVVQRGPRVMAYERAGAFLYDALRYRKAENPRRSYTTFARRVGLAASTVAGAATGHGKVPLASAEAIGRELGLEADDLRYFALLVELDNGDCPGRRTATRVDMAELRSRRGMVSIERDGGLAVARWPVILVHLLADSPSFVADPARLADAMIPPVPVEDVTEALDTLLKLGLLTPDATGVPRPTAQLVTMQEHTLEDAHLLRLLHATDIAEHALCGGGPGPFRSSARLVSVPTSRLHATLNAISDLQREIGALLAMWERRAHPSGVTMILLDATPWSRVIRRPR